MTSRIRDKQVKTTVNLSVIPDRHFGATEADWKRMKRMFAGRAQLPPTRRERFVRWAARLLGVTVEIPPRYRRTGGFIEEEPPVMPSYDFKLIPELAWVFVTAAVIALGTELVNFSSESFLADPGAFLLALALAAGRAGIAALIARLNGTFALR